ncbi:MAG: hypothetical protein ACP5NF_09455 [Thermoanaerobaculum sp.]
MEELINTHTRTLHGLCGAFVATTVVYGLLVLMVPPPETPVVMQTHPLLWIFTALAALNILTLMPVYRAMLAKPRQVYAISRDPHPLLAAHRAAHVVAFVRLEAVSLFGLVLFFITGRGDWFWYFNGAGLVGMLILWPLKEKVQALLESPQVGEQQVA